MFSDDNRLQLETDKIPRKNLKYWEIKEYSSNTWFKKSIRETRKYFVLNDHEIKTYKYLWDTAKKKGLQAKT